MGDVCVNPLPTLAFDPLLQMSVWPQKPIFRDFIKNTMFFLKTQCFQKIEKNTMF